MRWPAPEPGLVIRYSYLWQDEAEAGHEEGLKDRPCAIVLAAEIMKGDTVVYVLPITHSAPRNLDDAVELPQSTKMRLGLDDERSWVVVSEGNSFVWPGPDIRPLAGKSEKSAAYGLLPKAVFDTVRNRFLARISAGRSGIVKRTEG